MARPLRIVDQLLRAAAAAAWPVVGPVLRRHAAGLLWAAYVGAAVLTVLSLPLLALCRLVCGLVARIRAVACRP